MSTAMPEDQNTARLLPKRVVADQFGVSTRTIDRWRLDENLGFPAAIVIRDRAYWRASEIEGFKTDVAKRFAGGKAA